MAVLTCIGYKHKQTSQICVRNVICVHYTAHCTMYTVVNNKNYSKEKYIIPIPWYISNISNRLWSTIGGNRGIDQLYTTSQVSNITGKSKLSHTNCGYVFQD